MLPDQWQNKRYGDVTHLHKKVLITDHVMYQRDGIVLGQRNTTIICRPPPSSLISSNLPAQPLRQRHFCMEQQLQYLCEGRPFDVLCVDNTQKCSTQAGSKGRVRERETKTVSERSYLQVSFHKIKGEKEQLFCDWYPFVIALSYFPTIPFAKYIQLSRRRQQCVIYGSLPPSFIWDVYVKSMMLGEGEAGRAATAERTWASACLQSGTERRRHVL